MSLLLLSKAVKATSLIHRLVTTGAAVLIIVHSLWGYVQERRNKRP